MEILSFFRLKPVKEFSPMARYGTLTGRRAAITTG
jgi:hypothetical protein